MNERHRLRPIAQLLRPIERRVAAADDDDALAAKLFRIVDAVEDGPTIPGLRTRLRQTPRRKRTDPSRDHDGACRKPVVFCHQYEMITTPLERSDVLVEMRFEVELRRLFDERVDEILGQDFREPTDVEDVFLRIERG